MRAVWRFEVKGRQPGEVEDVDTSTEPGSVWLAAGLIEPAADEPKTKSTRKRAQGNGDDEDGGTQ